jgi:PAS domain S-box-containing protein
MHLLKNMSIRRKQTLIIMLTSSVVLLLACAVFVAYDRVIFRKELIEGVSVLAGAIGNNCAAAIDFNDPKSAAETLAALRASANIVSACVYSRDGDVFATYQRDAGAALVPPAASPGATAEFTGDQLHVFRPITQRGELTGTIFVASDLKAGLARLLRYISIVALVFLASLVLAFLLSNRLQRLISGPILQLAEVARSVAQDKNYSLRATKQSNDELGQLVDGFNEMLAQIQQRDVALQIARESLEQRVEARTGELAYERELLRALLDNSPDPIYFKDTQSRFLKASKTQAEFFGVKDVDELIGKTDFNFFAEAHARPAFEDEQEIIRTGRPMIGKVEKEMLKDGRESWALTSKMPLRDKAGEIIGTFGISKDITAMKETEAKLNQLHQQLLDTSRQAGMAEVATNVLHNVGNVLNSVNISTSLVMNSLKKSRVSNLDKVVDLLRQHESDLGTFFASDPRGKQLTAFLAQLATHLLAEQAATFKELGSLQGNVEHIKEIVAMQQSYAKVSGVKEIINVRELVENGLRMNLGSLTRHEVELIRDFENVPPINVEKHKVLQILVNMLRNAKHACDDSGRTDKQMTVRVADGDGRIRISVADNGVGIPPENLTRIFNHGFTTRKEGHGFGLHSGALAAKEMGGALTVHSDGAGKGATFTLELPCPTEGDVNE